MLSLSASALCRRRNASTARSGPSPSVSGASIRLFAGRPLRGGSELRAIRFRDSCVSVPVQRDVPEWPFETSLVLLTSDSIRNIECTPRPESVDGYPNHPVSFFDEHM